MEPGSHSADTSASGTFETHHDSERVPRGDDVDDPADDTASHQTISEQTSEDASEEASARADSDFAAAGSSDDDEDVSLDELIVGENHSTRVLVETTGILQNIVAVVFR